MTVQIGNRLIHDGLDYAPHDARPGPVFDPTRHGFRPYRLSTDCHRGFICTYGVTEGRLRLLELEINHADPSWPRDRPPPPPPAFHGVEATARTDAWASCAWKYGGLDLQLPYTGAILVSRGVLPQAQAAPDDVRLHGGLLPWEQAQSLVLSFDEGRLESARDVSDALRVLLRRYTVEGVVVPDHRRNARRFLARHLGPGFTPYPCGA